MRKKDFCTIIGNSMDWHYKLRDYQFRKKPFDIIGRINNNFYCIKVKYCNAYKSFNLKKIKDHQADALTEVGKSNVTPLVIYCCCRSLGNNLCYVFDWRALFYRRYEERNILQSELKDLPVCRVYKGKIADIEKNIIDNTDTFL